MLLDTPPENQGIGISESKCGILSFGRLTSLEPPRMYGSHGSPAKAKANAKKKVAPKSVAQLHSRHSLYLVDASVVA